MPLNVPKLPKFRNHRELTDTEIADRRTRAQHGAVARAAKLSPEQRAAIGQLGGIKHTRPAEYAAARAAYDAKYGHR